ncbi:Bidirectional sugar transporter SWEET14 [Olea europaea subsp. europaea]|uniref:Bidirectional sugar transporter SWEET n=1 Tax=Olea europaea subsp. europaea TaxID=158383 RepID=A0A8S0RPD8_OLEEU|nr:Bidirectional sugar transporter SWEET14 [Olea europaea subsp. europaea]
MSHLAFAFGILGSIVSFMVYLSPVPTFYRIYQKKSTEGFQSVPYVVGLFSSVLWIYYAFLKPNTTLLIIINSVGCFIQAIYICFYLFYATKNDRMQTVKLVLLLNVIGFGLIVLLTHFLTKGTQRAQIVGWICLVFSLLVFVAPLGILRKVIRTKSVEYMPVLLSFFLTLSAIMWFFYGLLSKDYNIAIPNILGFSFGIVQMVLYVIYKNAKKKVVEEKLPEVKNEIIALGDLKHPEPNDQIIDVVKLSAMMCSEIIAKVPQLNNNILSNTEENDKATTKS